MSRAILSTRLLIPKPRKGYVVRKSLFGQLDDLVNKRLTVIEGSPGSGKTTLLSSYIEQNTLTIQWITLDGECNHIVLFWKYMVEALSGLFGISADEYTTFLQTTLGQNRNEAVKTLINGMNQTDETVLVLDDFHVVENPDVLKSFAYFLANIPPTMHIVLLTRKKPELYLAGYELKNELLFLDEHDLWITDEEGLLFLKQTLSLSLPEESLLKLIDMAGGWIGGLQLMAASLTSKAATETFRFPANHAFLQDYMTTEIFDQLTPVEQDFLVLTSVPTSFSKTVVDYLLQDVDYHMVLSSLLDKNLMIQCVDEEQGWYRYHHLFRDYLLSRFVKLDQEQQTQVYRKLAWIFHELGHDEESLRHLFLLQDYLLAMSRILELPVGTTYYSSLSKVPVREAMKNFDFAFQKFFYHYSIYDYHICNALYEKAMLFRTEDLRYKAFNGFTQIYGWEAFNLNNDLILNQEIRNMDMLPLTQAMILTKNAAFLFHQNYFTAALEAVDESLAYEDIASISYIYYFNLTLKIQICEEMGLLGSALAVQEQARQLIDSNEMLRHLHAPTFSLTAAGLYMKQMRLEEARQILDECEEAIAERGGQLQLSHAYNRIEYLFLTGTVDEAVDLLNRLMSEKAYEDLLILSSLLKHLYRAGAMPKSMQDQFLLACESKSKETRLLNSRLLYARINAERGKQQSALAELEDVLRIARKQQCHLKIVEATMQLLSVMIGYSHDLRRLVDLYKEAIYHACGNNILLPFVMDSETVAAIHQQYGDKMLPELSKQEKEFHKRIMKLCMTKENCILSEREQEIMQLIAEGASNAQVSEKLFITIPTVKTHMTNILRKLETKSRMEAVSKLRQMGIIKFF